MPFDLDWVRALRRDRAQETQTFELKAGAALSRGDREVNELVKDITGLANAAGGTIVYGVAEQRQGGLAVAAHIDAVRDHTITAEWIEQVISSNTGPLFRGFKVHTIDAADESGPGRVVVIEVDSAATAHQSSRDHRYYQRIGTSTRPMLDFQVRDVMGRRTAPQISITIRRYRLQQAGDLHRYAVFPALRNDGTVSLQDWRLELMLPSAAYDHHEMNQRGVGAILVDEHELDGVRFRRARIPSIRNGVEHRLHPGDEVEVGQSTGYPDWCLAVNKATWRELKAVAAPIRWRLLMPNARPSEGLLAFADWCDF